MKQRDRVLKLHSLLGITCSLFLFIVCFAGTFSQFKLEITPWISQDARLVAGKNTPDLDAQVDSFLNDAAAKGRSFLSILTYPTDHSPYYDMEVTVQPPDGPPLPLSTRWSAADGAVLENAGTRLNQWMAAFHTDLLLPYPYGRSIVGFTGILLLILVMAGIYLHKNPLRTTLLWRPGGSMKVLLLDSHNALGLWGFPFHLVMAFSGAVLGLTSLLGIIYGMLVFDGGAPQELEPMPLTQIDAPGLATTPLSVSKAQEISQKIAGIQPTLLIMVNRGKDTSVYRIYHEVEKPMVRFGILDLDGTTGEVLTYYPAPPTPIARPFVSVMPLHTGTYGGGLLKALYGFLGLGLCLIIATGIMMWLERIAREKAPQDQRLYKTMSALAAGTCLGFPLATLFTLYADQFLDVAGARSFWIGVILFAFWGAALLFAFMQKNQYRTVKIMLATMALLLAGLPLFNFMDVFTLWQQGVTAVGTADLTFLFLAALLMWICRRLPKNAIEWKG